MRSDEYSVSLSSVAREQDLKILHAAKDFDSVRVRTADINRPALQLAGFYDYFDPKRLQLIGRVESTFLESLGSDQRREALERFMRFDICAIILCHGIDPSPELLETARKYDRTVMSTQEDTSTFMADLISMLRNAMAPRVTMHGVLVEVYGEGLLITGDSGVGKSETALEPHIPRDAHRHRPRAHTLLYGAARHRRHQRAAHLRRRRGKAGDERGPCGQLRALGRREDL